MPSALSIIMPGYIPGLIEVGKCHTRKSGPHTWGAALTIDEPILKEQYRGWLTIDDRAPQGTSCSRIRRDWPCALRRYVALRHGRRCRADRSSYHARGERTYM